jgi:hypothetical protein
LTPIKFPPGEEGELNWEWLQALGDLSIQAKALDDYMTTIERAQIKRAVSLMQGK